MAAYEVNGQRYELPDDLTQGQLIETLTMLSGAEPTEPQAPKYGFDHIDKAASEEFGSGDTVRALTQGLSFGLGDEMEAGLNAASDWLGGKGELGELYDGYHAALNDRMKAFRDDSPLIGYGSEIVGAIPTGGLLAKGASKIASIANMSRLKQAATIGAAEGGIYGFNSGTDERLKDAVIGAGIGGVGAPVGVKLFDLGGDLGVKAAAQAKRLLTDTPEAKAKRIVTDALNYGGNGDEVIAKLHEMGPDATLMDVSDGVKTRLAHGAAQIDGPFHTQAVKAMDERQAGQMQRLLDGAGSELGKDPDFNLPQWLNDISQAQAEQAKPLYDAVRQIPFKPSKGLSAALESVSDEGQLLAPVLKEAEKRYKLRNFEGEWNPSTIEAYDYVKRIIDDKIGKAVRAGEKDLSASYMNVKRQLVSEMDEATVLRELPVNGPRELPGVGKGDSLYAKARGTYAGAAELKDAAELGSRVLRDDYDDMAILMKDFTQSQREAFKGGAMKAIRDRLEQSTDWNDASRRLLPVNLKKRLRNAFDSDEQYQNFIAELDKEQAFRQTLNDVKHNSQTALRQSAKEQMGASGKLPGIMEEAAADSATNGVSRVASWISKLIPQKSVDDETLRALAEIALKRGLTEDELRRLLTQQGSKLPSVDSGSMGVMVSAPVTAAIEK